MLQPIHHNIYVTANPFSKVFHDSSNWNLMSCQLHRVASGMSNSGYKQKHISELFSHIYDLVSKGVQEKRTEVLENKVDRM